MFNEATIPNSFNNLLSVKMNVPKPAAVVKFVIKVAFPTLEITLCKDLALFP